MEDKKEGLKTLVTVEGFQKYILGTKKDGSPRSVYDVMTDIIPALRKTKKKNKKKKKNQDNGFSIYISKKGKKKKKKNKHWHI